MAIGSNYKNMVCLLDRDRHIIAFHKTKMLTGNHTGCKSFLAHVHFKLPIRNSHTCGKRSIKQLPSLYQKVPSSTALPVVKSSFYRQELTYRGLFSSLVVHSFLGI